MKRGEISEDEYDFLRKLRSARTNASTPVDLAVVSRETLNPPSQLNSRLILFFVGVWLLPVLGLFALGHAVGWIIRGFKAETKLAAKVEL